MYVDCFDSVKTQIELHGNQGAVENAFFSETYLYNLLLTGYKPCLTPSQCIDSTSIFNITYSNQDAFIKLIKNGFITINLFPGELSLRNHFVKTLSEGVLNENPFYEFSIFPFLSHFKSEQRKKIQEAILSNINNHYTNFHIDGLSNEEAEYMETVFDNFQIVDILSQKEIKQTKRFSQNMNELLMQFSQEVQDEEFSSLYTDLKIDNEGKTVKSYRRSVFYDFLRRMQSYYSGDVIQYMRNLVDCSYNLTIASAVDDKEGSDISTKFSSIVNSATIEKLNPNACSCLSLSEQKNVKTQITWDDVLEILTEVSHIEKEKNVSRIEALKIYKSKQTVSNVFKVCKYLVGNTLKTLVPGLDAMSILLNIASDVGINAGTELLDDKFEMQSIGELCSDIKSSRKKSKVVNSAIETIDFYSCNFGHL